MAELVGPSGDVLAVEAIPQLAQELKGIMAAGAQRNVTVIPRALYHERTTVRFRVVTNDPARSGIEKTRYPFEPAFEEIAVATILIDDILGREARCRLFKLDLEGGEFRALQGARDTIAAGAPFIIFENSGAASAGLVPVYR